MKKKQVVSMVLAVLMIFGIMPFSIFNGETVKADSFKYLEDYKVISPNDSHKYSYIGEKYLSLKHLAFPKDEYHPSSDPFTYPPRFSDTYLSNFNFLSSLELKISEYDSKSPNIKTVSFINKDATRATAIVEEIQDLYLIYADYNNGNKVKFYCVLKGEKGQFTQTVAHNITVYNYKYDILRQQKQAAKDEIAKMPELTTDQIKGYQDRVDKATTPEAVQAIVDEAKSVSDKLVADKKALEKAKTEAISKIDALKNLTEEEKAPFKTRINEAKDIPSIDNVVSEATAEDTKKATLKEAKTTEAVVTALEDAMNKDALEKAKKAAIVEVNKLPNLSDTEKAEFVNKINAVDAVNKIAPIVEEAKTKDASNPEEIQPIVDAAKAKDKENLDKAKKEAKDIIDKNQDIDPSKKNAIKEEIDKADTVDEVNDIVDNNTLTPEQKEVKELAKAKEEAKNEINALPNLSQEEKNAFIDQIDKAKNKAEVAKILEDAKAKDLENAKTSDEKKALDEAKDNAKKAIEAMDGLTTEEKKTYEDEIDKSTTPQEVQDIVDRAKEVSDKAINDKQTLDQAKEDAKKVIDELKNLTPEEKTKAKEEIDKAIDKTAVDKIVENAKNNDKEKSDAKTLDETKDAAKKTIDELKNLAKEEKETVKKAIDEATNKEAIEKIVKEAKAKDTKASTKSRDELIKDLRDLLDKVEKIKDPSRRLERAIDEAYKVLLDKESTSKDIEEAISRIKDIVKRERYDLEDDYRLKIDNINIDSKSISGRTESKWYVDIYSGRTRIGRGEADRRGYFDIKLNNYTLKKDDKIKVVASDPDDDDKYVEKKVSINSQNTIDLNNIDTKTLLEMLGKGTVNTNTNNNEYAIFPVGQNYYVVYNNMTPNKVTMDAKTFIRNNRTMVPLRYIAYTLGFNVEYNNATREAIFTNTSNDTLTKKSLRINIDTGFIIDSFGKVYTTDSKPVIINNRIYAPIANIARFFDATQGTLSDGINNTIEWDPVNYLVYVYRNVR